MSLSTYFDRFRQLNVNVAHGRASPHKICMLLAVLDLARGGALTANRVEFAPPLLERYALYFNAVRAEGDHPNPYFPFFHLAGRLRGGGESFWHLQPKSGREHVLASMSTARTVWHVTDNIDHARLDAELFDLLQDALAVDTRSAVIAPDMHWALDRHLIAPHTDFRWRVSRALDRRIPDYQVLTELEGKPLFLPREAHMYPKREAIEWRLAMLHR